MGCYVYCLYSTEDGEPRYVGRSSTKVSYRFKQHITAALDREPSALYDWMRDVWRRDFDVAFHILQEGIIPKDLDFFKRYWIDQFANLLNIECDNKSAQESPVAKDIKAALRAKIQQGRDAI